jgi:hypothetical protein
MDEASRYLEDLAAAGTLAASLGDAGFFGAFESSKAEARVQSIKTVSVPLPPNAVHRPQGEEALRETEAEKGWDER